MYIDQAASQPERRYFVAFGVSRRVDKICRELKVRLEKEFGIQHGDTPPHITAKIPFTAGQLAAARRRTPVRTVLDKIQADGVFNATEIKLGRLSSFDNE